MASVQEILFKLTGRETVSPATRAAAAGLKRLGASADDARRDAKQLEEQLEDTERQIHDLTRALAKDPGDIGLRKQLRALDRESKNLRGLQRRLGDAGGEAAEKFGVRFVQRVGPLVASAPVGTTLVGSIAAAAPLISGAVSAAVAAGAAAGTVALGAALASRRTEVARAWTGLGEEILSGLTVDAGVFSEPLIEASERARSEFRKLRPEIQGLFSDAAQHVAPLSRALAGLGRELVPGLREAVREAGPVVDVLQYKLPSAGRTTSNALKTITEDSENAAAALSTLLTGTEIGIQASANSLGLLNKALPFTTGALLKANDMLTKNDQEAAAAAAANEKLATAQSRAGQAAARTEDEIAGLTRAYAEAAGETLDAEQANLRMEQSGRRLGSTFKDNAKNIKNNRDRLLENKSALLDYASDVRSAAAATRTQTGSQDAANRVLDEGRRKFLAAASAAGIEAAAAKNLANKLFGIPGQRTTKINVNKQQAERDIASVNARANNAARARTIRFNVAGAVSGSLGAAGQRGMAEGGLITGGVRGKDSVPILAMPGEGVLSLQGMKALGGKAALDALNAGRVAAPASGGVGGAANVNVVVSAGAGMTGDLGRALLRELRFQVQTNGGNVQRLLGA